MTMYRPGLVGAPVVQGIGDFIGCRLLVFILFEPLCIYKESAYRALELISISATHITSVKF